MSLRADADLYTQKNGFNPVFIEAAEAAGYKPFHMTRTESLLLQLAISGISDAAQAGLPGGQDESGEFPDADRAPEISALDSAGRVGLWWVARNLGDDLNRGYGQRSMMRKVVTLADALNAIASRETVLDIEDPNTVDGYWRVLRQDLVRSLYVIHLLMWPLDLEERFVAYKASQIISDAEDENSSVYAAIPTRKSAEAQAREEWSARGYRSTLRQFVKRLAEIDR